MMDFATRSRLIHLTPPMPLSPTRQPPESRRSPLKTLRNLAGLNPPCLILPRSVVHWMKLELPGVPRRFVASSLSLRLRQILGDIPCGFAWTLRGNTAELWYWHEDDKLALFDIKVNAAQGVFQIRRIIIFAHIVQNYFSHESLRCKNR